MGLNAKTAGSSNKTPQAVIEADVYPAYLVQLIDLGLQNQRAFEGKAKPPAQEIMLTYELSDCFMQDDEGEDMEDKPRWIGETLPFYGLQADKAKSTLRYLAFDPTQEFDGDFAKAVGQPCNLTVVNKVSQGKTYNNVGNVAPISAKKAAVMNPLKNPTKVFDLDEPDMDVFNSLPDWIKKKICENLNFKGSPLEKAMGGEEAPKKEAGKKEKAKPAPEPEDDEDNPY